MDNLVDKMTGLLYTQKLTPGADGGPTLADARLDPPLAVITYQPDAQSKTTLRLGRKLLGGHSYVTLEGDENIYVVNDALHDTIVEGELTSWRKKSFDPPSADQINRITLLRDDKALDLRKIDGRWFMDEQATQRADTEKVKKLADAVSYANINEFVADNPENLGLYGLAVPTTVITLRPAAEDGQAHTLRIGAPRDMKEETFFATWSAGDDSSPVVFTIDKYDADQFDVATVELRDPRVFTTEAQDARELLIDRAGASPIHLARETTGLEFAEPGPGYDADRTASTQLLDDITALEGDGYEPDYTPDGEPVVTVELTRRGSGQERVRFFADGEDYIALHDGETVGYRIPADKAEVLFKPGISLRHRVVADIAADDIQSLELSRDETTYRFTRDGDEWRMNGQADFEHDALNSLLGALAPLLAEDWNEKDFDSTLTLTVETEDGAQTLRVAPDSRLAGLDEVETFVLPQSTVDLLSAEYRDRSVLPITLDDIASVKLDQDDMVMTFRRNADGVYEADKLDTVDQVKAAALFNALAGLRAQSYRETEGIDLDQPFITLIVNTADEAEHSIALWKGDRVLGRLDDADRLFVLSESSVEDFDIVLNPPEITEE